MRRPALRPLPRPAGLLGFPPKDLQHRFLCFFKPVFYIRQRDYSKVRACAAPCCRVAEQPGGQSGSVACVHDVWRRETSG